MKSLILALTLCVGAIPALAQDQTAPSSPPPSGGRAMFMQACGADMQSFCGSAQSREDRHACLMQNKDKFSDSCKSFMASHPMHQHGQGGQMQGPPAPGPGGGQ